MPEHFERRIINSPDGGGQLELTAHFAEGGHVKVLLLWTDLVSGRKTLLAEKDLQSTVPQERKNPWGLRKKLLSSPLADPNGPNYIGTSEQQEACRKEANQPHPEG